MLANAVLALNEGFENLFMSIMLDRERAVRAKEVLTGSRAMADYIVVGGVRRDLDDIEREKITRLLDALAPRPRALQALQHARREGGGPRCGARHQLPSGRRSGEERQRPLLGWRGVRGGCFLRLAIW